MSLTNAVAANAAAAAAGAGKKAAQVQLQAELNTDEEWNKFLQRDGLLVIDVYSEWCGPCVGMVGNLKKIKVEVGGDNLHLAVAKADSIECLKRFRHRSEPTWMFIAGGQLINVVFGADAPRLARTIEQELKNEEEVKKGERTRPQRAPHELTPDEQVKEEILQKKLKEKVEKEAAAAEAARTGRRESRAKRLETYFMDVCPALMLPHAQKHIRKVTDALEPYGVVVADKCPIVLGKEGAKRLAVEEPELKVPAVSSLLIERPSLGLLLKKLPEKDGDVIALCREALCGDGIESEEGVSTKKILSEELRADSVPGIYIPSDRHQRAAVLDLLFPKMVGAVVEPPPPVEPPHVAMVFGAWQRRAILNAAADPKVGPRVLRYGFFANVNIDEPILLCKTLEQYERRPEKEYCETIALMVAVGPAEPELDEGEDTTISGPPPQLASLVPLHVSEDAVTGAEECSRLFPPGYNSPEQTPKPKAKKKKKKRTETKEEATEESTVGITKCVESGEGGVHGEGDDPEGEASSDAEGEGDGKGEEEDASSSPAVDKATSPPPQATN